jgi:peptidoglycan L-alanyl-D-glutamate endopeptidase CwlK
MSRKIKDLVPELQSIAIAFAAKLAQEGIPFIFTCTYRSQKEQDALYAQGRTAPGKIVTWATHSRHTDRRAFDIAICKGKVPTWDRKADVNENEIPDYLEAGIIGERLGLVWGGRWKTPDYPHFELPICPKT